jgi:hypothetical protein
MALRIRGGQEEHVQALDEGAILRREALTEQRGFDAVGQTGRVVLLLETAVTGTKQPGHATLLVKGGRILGAGILKTLIDLCL